MRNIIAIDAGFVAMGWAIMRNNSVVQFGCIRTQAMSKKHGVRKADDDIERIQHLAKELVRLCEAWDVAGIVAEMPNSGARGARAISCMARAQAIVASVAAILELPAEWITPDAVKKWATGKRNASKEDVEVAVSNAHPFVVLPEVKCEREHIVDAIAAFESAKDGVLVRAICA